MTHTYVTDVWDQGFAVMRFPVGAVGLDIDAPTAFFEEGPGRDAMLEGVRALADETSQRFGLGLYWMYHTLSGVHVLFQCRLSCWEAVKYVLTEAFQNKGWHECGGHALHCSDAEEVQLRVGHKPGRPWDITPVPGNPPMSHAPAHVQEHARLLAQRLPARGCEGPPDNGALSSHR